MTISIPSALETELNEKKSALFESISDHHVPFPFDVHDRTDFNKALEATLLFSHFAARNLIREPEILADLAASGDLTGTRSRNIFSSRLSSHLAGVTDEAALMHRLRIVRRREIIRIIWRDLAGWADLAETMADLSALADTCLDQALDILYRWNVKKHGTPTGQTDNPQRLVVLGMGKLGARELNLSSDIDLIFAFPESGHTAGGRKTITNEMFFTRLCRKLVKVIGEQTTDGRVFRVDLNLRPFGENGPLVMSFQAMESYYQAQGREWERYAMIKRRVAAGDRRAGYVLMDILRPFVFRRYLDFGVYDAVREMKAGISAEIRQSGIEKNIKLGPGGIREIEFFGQVFQLLRGGVEKALRSRPILDILSSLSRLNLAPETVCGELADAYRFLRMTEHRLQAKDDAQTHDLPEDAKDRARLALSMGFAGWRAFQDKLRRHMGMVHRHFNDLLEPGKKGPPVSKIDALSGVWRKHFSNSRNQTVLSRAGYRDCQSVLNLLSYLRDHPAAARLDAAGNKRLNRLVPLILKASGKTKNPGKTLTRIIDILLAIGQRTNYFALLLEAPRAVSLLARLTDKSPKLAADLARHPVLLDELLDARTLFSPPDKTQMEEEISRRLLDCDPKDLECQIETLCVFRQTRMFRVAAADVMNALPLMRVSDHLSWMAEVILEKVLDLAWEHLTRKHGRPVAELNGKPLNRGFMVTAYGKLGGLELGYGSDLDLVFLHAGRVDAATGGRRSVDTRTFYARLGRRILHILTTPTQAGVLYEVDMRLRPSGSAGPLVYHLDAFSDYQARDAWIWEHQALVRARAICGDPALMKRFDHIRRRIIALKRDKTPLAPAVVDMRERLRKQRLKTKAGKFDVKQSRGGLVDIEFLVQYLILLHSRKNKALTRWTDNVRQINALAATGVLNDMQAHLLKKAYLTYRAVIHRRNLLEKPAVVPKARFSLLLDFVTRIWQNTILHYN